jgi:secondary thiamine-phosphate synthase enzyme
MSVTETLDVRTKRRCEFVEVTDRVRDVVRQSGVERGHLICYNPHTTAGCTIQENADPDVVHDVLLKLERLVGQDEAGFLHAEGNSDSHIKASMMGSSVTVLIEAGRLVLGRWQGIYFTEFDGPRHRQLHVRIVED